MAVPGIIDSTTFIEVSPNIDVGYLRNYETADGVSFDQLIPRINGALGAFNGEIDPLVAELIAPPTERIVISSRNPGRFKVVRNGEYTPARAQRPGKRSKHALPIWVGEIGMGFTERGLGRMKADDIVDLFDEALAGLRYNQRYSVLARMLDDAEVPVDEPDLTEMMSPGFAGSGTGANAFPAKFFPNQITPVPNGYSHYWRIAAAGLGAGIAAMAAQHRRWYPTGHFDLVGSKSVTDAVVALGEAGGFIRAERAFVREGNGSTVATIDADRYLGILGNDVWVRRPIEDYTDACGWLFQPLGNLNPRNPLAWRFNPKAGQTHATKGESGGPAGRGAYLRTMSNFPLADADILQELGVGINNLTGAEVFRIAETGTYQPPAGYSAG